MKSVRSTVVLYCVLFAISPNLHATMVSYITTDLGGSQFQYEYNVTNDTLGVPIRQFTIWFDVELYDNLAITTEDPPASEWNEIILEKTGFGLPIGYDALADEGGVPPSETVGGFLLRFDWLGINIPGPQFFEIIDPVTSQTLDSGYTIPEPATFLLLGLAGLGLLRTRRARA